MNLSIFDDRIIKNNSLSENETIVLILLNSYRTNQGIKHLSENQKPHKEIRFEKAPILTKSVKQASCQK